MASSDLGRDNLSRVAASATELKTVLLRETGLMVEVKRWVAKDATDHGQVISDSDLTNDAIFERLVYHMEAGNRCYDFRVPEESNRRIIDHISSVLMPYTNRSRENLLREGIASEDIYVTGNPINEVLEHLADKIAASPILTNLKVKERRFFLVTMHRAENVDVERRLRGMIESLILLHNQFGLPILCSLHPRTRSKATLFGISLDHPGLTFFEPFGFFDFIRLEKSAFCVLSDSGTVQEEACILSVPNVTIRDVTERPETIECGSNVLAGCNARTIVKMVNMVTQKPPAWRIPPEYLTPNVANTVSRIILGCRR
jgi:UDP-N-acetylglucosamine 2-epimerase (non-hydrolysing)